MARYDDLVRDYHALAFRVARSVLRDDASAEDAVQDLYLRFLRDPGMLEQVESMKAFVARAAVNAALDLRRRVGRREKYERAARREEAAMSPVDAAARVELRAKVAELPQEQRLAVELHYFHGLTKEETAHAMQVPAGTVSSRLNAGLSRLRTMLSGAALAGLLAMLESELGKCGAEEAVPAGLEKTLLRMRTEGRGPAAGASVHGGRRWPAAAIAGGVLLAVAVGILVLQASRRGIGDATGAAVGNTDLLAATGSSNPAPVPLDPAGRTRHVAPSSEGGDSRVEFTLEGFLFRRDGGVYLRDVDPGEHLPVQRMWDGRAERLRAWKESLTVPGGIPGIPATADSNFGPFLLEGVDPALAPQVRLRLRVRGPRPPEPEEDAAHPDMELPVVPPQPAELVEVVEAEVLGHAWLTAWRELQGAVADLWSAWALPPGAGRRSALLEAATRIGATWEQARVARRGDRTVTWRTRRESEAVSGSVERLAQVGLDGLVPAWPSRDDLHAALMDAHAPEALRRALLDRWGVEALGLEAWCHRSIGPGAWGLTVLPLSEVLAMSDTDFARLREELHGIPDNRVGTDETPGTAERRRTETARVAAFGLAVRALSSLDRERYLVECGATVLSVTPGSPAEQLGLQAGDVLWKTVGTWEGKTGRVTGEVPVWGESGLSTLVDESGAMGRHILALKVLRAGDVLELRVPE